MTFISRSNAMTTFRRAVSLLVLLAAFSGAQAQHRKDAAEAVQEGSVANWMEYYKRERVGAQAGQQTAPKPAPAADTSPVPATGPAQGQAK